MDIGLFLRRHQYFMTSPPWYETCQNWEGDSSWREFRCSTLLKLYRRLFDTCVLEDETGCIWKSVTYRSFYKWWGGDTHAYMYSVYMCVYIVRMVCAFDRVCLSAVIRAVSTKFRRRMVWSGSWIPFRRFDFCVYTDVNSTTKAITVN